MHIAQMAHRSFHAGTISVADRLRGIANGPKLHRVAKDGVGYPLPDMQTGWS